MIYKTYAEAKIANPDSEIVTTGQYWAYGDNRKGLFESLRFYSDVADHRLSDEAWVICNPADHCSSLKEFLDTGFKLVCGDKIQTSKKSIFTITDNNSGFNNKDGSSNEVFILSATALNGGCKIPSKTEQWTVYNNTLPLCELTDEQVGAIFRYGIEKGVIEVMDDNGKWWDNLSLVGWHTALAYRAKQKSERELFIEAAIGHGIKPETQSPKQIFGELFDSGKFKYIDSTSHFGENI